MDMATNLTKEDIANLILSSSRFKNSKVPSGEVSFTKPGEGLYSNGEIAIDIKDSDGNLKYRTMATVEETIALNYIQLEHDLATAINTLKALSEGHPLDKPLHQIIDEISF